MSKIQYSQLDEETKRRLRERFDVDGRASEEVTRRTVTLGKVLKAIERLTNADALWVLDQAVILLLPPSEVQSEDDKPREISMEEVVRVTAKAYGVEYEDLIGRGRTEAVVDARQMAMYILSSSNKYSLRAVGIAIGRRSPATISYAYTKVHGQLEHSLTMRNLLKEIKLRLGIIEPEKGGLNV